MTAIGATSSLPVALARVRSQFDLPTFAIARCRPAIFEIHDLRPGKPPEGELDLKRWYKGSESFGEVLEILGRRLGSKHEKVRSTTQRRGKTTKPFCRRSV
jgi:hypothetical protein